MKMTPLIVGNWKLNPTTQTDAALLAVAVARKCKTDKPLVAVAPPFVYLTEVVKKLQKSSVVLAAQDVFTQPLGPFTGEISVAQLKDIGVSYIIIGHSERRALGESNELIREKALAVLKYNLTPIVCVGELKRDSQGDFFGFIENQLRSLTEVLSPTLIKKIVIAYEPIWAIGTGTQATPEDVKEIQLFITSVLSKIYDRATVAKIRLLYGGSVRSTNVAELHALGGMNGFLVGGASLRADEFNEIVKAVS